MLKTVNLEEGMPLVDAAIRRATFELKSGRRMGLTAIKFIHGYGSSGNGGKTRSIWFPRRCSKERATT